VRENSPCGRRARRHPEPRKQAVGAALSRLQKPIELDALLGGEFFREK
jgi:hypothetical protein